VLYRTLALAHRNELLGTGWMNGDRIVEVAFGGAHANRHRESLHHFVGARAYDGKHSGNCVAENADQAISQREFAGKAISD